MNMQALMQQAQKMQREAAKKQKELEEKVFHIESSGGAIVLDIKGSREIVKLEIDKDAIDPDDKEMLEEMLMIAFNEVNKLINQANEALSSQLTSGLRMPGF